MCLCVRGKGEFGDVAKARKSHWYKRKKKQRPCTEIQTDASDLTAAKQAATKQKVINMADAAGLTQSLNAHTNL